MMKHHEFSPSSLLRLSLCPGSYKLSRGREEQESEEASAGTVIHDAVAKRSIDGLSAEDAELVTRCLEQMDRFGGMDGWIQEEKVSVIGDNFETITYGTPDAWKKHDGRIVLIDWKSGYLFQPQPRDNPQMLTYALGLMQATGVDQVQAIVYYPRSERCDEDFLNASVLDPWLDQLQMIIATAQADGLVLKAGEDQCRYCRAQSICPEFRTWSTDLVTTHSSEIADPAEMARALELAKMAKKWAKAVRYHAKKRMIEGEEVPGWGLRKKRGRQKITDPQAAYELTVGNKNGLSHEEFMSHVKISPKELADAWARVLKPVEGGTLKGYREEFAERLTQAGALERGSDGYSLVQQKVER